MAQLPAASSGNTTRRPSSKAARWMSSAESSVVSPVGRCPGKPMGAVGAPERLEGRAVPTGLDGAAADCGIPVYPIGRICRASAVPVVNRDSDDAAVCRVSLVVRVSGRSRVCGESSEKKAYPVAARATGNRIAADKTIVFFQLRRVCRGGVRDTGVRSNKGGTVSWVGAPLTGGVVRRWR